MKKEIDNSIYKSIIDELLKMLDEGVYIVDDEGVGIFYNDAMAKIEQIDIDDVVGKEYHRAFPGVTPAESTMFQALKKGKTTPYTQQTYKNLYGREVTTMNTTRPIYRDGEVVAAVEVARDITNLKSMRDTILDLQDRDVSTRNKELGIDYKPNVVSKIDDESDELPNTSRKRHGIAEYTFDDIVGRDPKFLEAINRAKKAAENSATVFIYGETGTGKELFAQSIHGASARKNMPFLAQNCAALPETLLEGILFGTSKGGFTGAVDRAGLFEQASGGTLLLDEVSAMPYELQGKLLRVLQERYLRRVGGTKDIYIDTRIIATVNEDPIKLINDGRLRKDLYYRLSVVNVSIPPLRDRKDDIPLLVDAFLDEYNQEFGKELWMADEKAIRNLKNHDYPGNVRELENIIVQAVSMAGNEHVLTDRNIQMPAPVGRATSDIAGRDLTKPLPDYIGDIEREIIREALLENGGNISKAADDLGIMRQTLQHKMKKYGLK